MNAVPLTPNDVENKYRSLFESAADSIFLMKDDRFVECNPHTLTLFGCSADQIIGRTPIDFSPPSQPDGCDSKDKAHEKIAAALAGRPQVFEWQHRRLDGTLFDAEVSLNRVQLSGEYYLHAVVRDITQRKAAEVQLRNSEAELRALFAAMTDVILVLDANGRYLDIAPTNPSLLYRPADKLIGKTLAEVFPAERAEQFMHGIREALTTRETVNLEYSLNLNGRDVWFAAALSPMLEDQIIFVARDITDSKQAEEALRESEERYRRLIDLSPDAIAVHRDGKIIFVNAASLQLMGASSADQLIGRSALEVVHPDSRALAAQRIREMLAQGTSAVPVEEKFIRLDGSTVEVEVVAAPLTFYGQPAIQIVARDITYRKQRERALEVIGLVASALRLAQTRAEMLEIVLGEITQLLELDGAVAALFDPISSELSLELASGQWANLTGRRISSSPGIGQQILSTGQPMSSDNAAADPRFAQLKQFGELQAITAIPLSVAGAAAGGSNSSEQTIGVLWAGRAAPFAPAEIQQLSAIGNIAANAIHRAALFEQAQRRAEQLAIVNTLGRALAETFDLPQIYDRLYEAIQQLLPDTAAIFISLFDPDRQQITCAYAVQDNQPVNVAELPAIPLAPPGQGTQSQVIHSRQPMIVNDLQQYVSQARSKTLVGQTEQLTQSALYIPMLTKGQAIGILQIQSYQPNRYSQADAELLAFVANTAAVAIENAGLFEAERSQRSLAEALRDTTAVLNSTLRFDEVLDRMLAIIGRVVPHDAVNIMLIDPQRNTARVTRCQGYDEIAPGLAAAVLKLEFSTIELTNLRQMLASGEPFVVADTRAFPGWVDTPETRWVRSHAGAPIRLKDSIVGFFNVDSATPNFFNQTHAERLRAFTDQAAVAIENARLFEAERKQLRLARTLQAVGALLTAEMNLDEVFEHIFDLLARVVDYDSVSLQLIEDGHAYLAAGRGFPNIERTRQIIGTLTTPTLEERWGQQHQHVVVIPDTYADPRWIRVLGNDYIRSWIGAALRVKGRLLGILNVDSATPNAYNESLGDTVATFANQAAIAIENAQLHDTVRRHADELEQHVIERTAELERERRRVQAILDTANEGIVFTDVDGRIEYINPATERLTGYALSEAYGQTPSLWRSEDTNPQVFTEMWQAITHGRSWRDEIVNRRKDGSRYEAEVSINPLTDNEGQIIGYVSVQHDITRQKELDRLKDQFVSNVSHELRTPLTNVKLYLGLLTRGKPEKRGEYLQTLQRETQRLEKLIEDLLDISRLDLDAVPIELSPTDLNQLISQLIQDRAALAAEHRLTIEYQPAPDLPLVSADAAMLTQIMSNLLTNAINYTPARGHIQVRTAPRRWAERDLITVTIQDNGPGIPPDELPRLFERFHRGQAGRKSGMPGTGLGLAISQEIVDKLGGLISVESELGQGTAFTVWLNPAR